MNSLVDRVLRVLTSWKRGAPDDQAIYASTSTPPDSIDPSTGGAHTNRGQTVDELIDLIQYPTDSATPSTNQSS